MSESRDVLRLEDLVSASTFGVTVLAGEQGLSRKVLWAHSCELLDPERWLGPNELLMTVGLCVPTDPQEQRAFIARLDDAGIVGIMIGDHESAPPVSHEMLDEASQRGFPVLFVTEQTPYAVVARHVAAANSSAQILQILKVSKLYQRAANIDADAKTLLADFASLLRVGLRVRDQVSGLPVLEAAAPFSSTDGLVLREHPLSGAHPAVLQIIEHPGEPLDSFLLVHLKTIIEVHADRVLSAVDHRARISAQTLSNLLNGRAPAPDNPILTGDGLRDGYHVASLPSESGARVARIVAIRRLPAFAGHGAQDHHIIAPHTILSSLREIAESTGIHMGVSSRFSDPRDASSAAEEASRVLASSRHSSRLWTQFSGTSVSLLARSRQEGEAIVANVLGPLAEHSPAMDKLRTTLFTYLRQDRRWRETADELGVHRQTLSYRLRRIEEETGMSTTRSADISALWIAYQAWESLASES